MKKRNFWPVFFVGLFGFGITMITWTIVSAVNTPVFEDETFLSSYQNVDENYNKIVESNKQFKTKYDVEFNLNGNKFPLIISDIFLSQRVLEENPTHKDYFVVGSNNLLVNITDKKGNIVDGLINFRVTKAIQNKYDINISNKESKATSFDFNVPNPGNWNLTGTIDIGNDKGYFFIKSNATSK